MTVSAQLSGTDKRRATRHPADFAVVAEHRKHGDVQLHIVNASAEGFMVKGLLGIQRGERVVMRLPVVGRIEAHLVWSHNDRAGFQFERIIRQDDLLKLVEALQLNTPLRLKR